jgi:hypothetical protein
MSQLQTSRMVQGAVNPSDLDYFRMPVYEHFKGEPFHVYRIYIKGCDFPKILRDIKSKVIRSRQLFNPSLPEPEWEQIEAVLFEIDGAYCYITESTLYCYASNPEIAKKTGLQMMQRYATPMKKEHGKPKFHVLNLRSDTLHIEVIEIVKPFELTEDELQFHYGADALEFENYITGAWNTETAGLTIFRGSPGTGKTSYIRHLISKLRQTHRFYYLPINAVRYLSAPDMVDFWLRVNRISTESKKIVVLEDAEDLLVERGADNRAKVSAMLNIGDGLMSDYLQLHLLCTVNCPLDKLDPAITRPGRLTAVREFRRLDRKHAERIATAKAITLPKQDDYSLAEIYRGNQWRDDQQAGKKIGFAVS